MRRQIDLSITRSVTQLIEVADGVCSLCHRRSRLLDKHEKLYMPRRLHATTIMNLISRNLEARLRSVCVSESLLASALVSDTDRDRQTE